MCPLSMQDISQFKMLDFPGGSDGKEFACNVGDGGSTPGSGRFPREENGNQLQDSCWRIPWIEEPGGLHPCSHKELDMNE